MLYRPGLSAAIPNSILQDRVFVDLLDELEIALSIIESVERRSRNSGTSARLITAAVAVDTAILYLRDLRG
jgi:hypothetical protein